jgi:phosphatidylserine decarboxylase
VANYPHPIIAREGWPFVAIAIVVALLLTAGQYWILAALAWLGALFVLQFFRYPSRVVPMQRNAVL